MTGKVLLGLSCRSGCSKLLQCARRRRQNKFVPHILLNFDQPHTTMSRTNHPTPPHNMPKATTPTSPGKRQARRHNPLSEDLVATGPLRSKASKRTGQRDEEDGDKFLDAKASRKILKIGQDLAEEDESYKVQASNGAFTFESRLEDESQAEEEQYGEDDDAWGDEEEEMVQEVVRPSR